MNKAITERVHLIFAIIIIYAVTRWGRHILMLLGAGGLARIYAKKSSKKYCTKMPITKAQWII